MQQPSDSIPDDEHTRQNPLDEPPWSPELLDTITQLGHVWLCHDRDDADLLLRPDAGNLPALCVSIQQVQELTPALIKPLQRIVVMQRPDDALDDGFYARYGLTVKAHLEGVGWRGTLYRVPLSEVIPTVGHLWTSPAVHEDRDRFQFELVTLQQNSLAEKIQPSRRAKRSQASGPQPIIVHADQVQAKPIEWLWQPYLPCGMVVLLDGDPGLGKGLMLVQVVANLSRAWPFLDQLGKPTLMADVEGPQTTLMLSAEESLEHVMVPRLTRAKADLSRIKFLTGYFGPEDEERAFDLSHMPVLVQAIKTYQPALVILDPLVAYLGPIDMYRANHTRPLMMELRKVAERYGCTILGVRHPGKTDQGGRLLYRGQGNIDLIGSARSGLWVQPHPTHPETQTMLLQSKSNVGGLGRTMIFSRAQGEFSWKGASRLTEAMLTGKGPEPWSFLEAFFWLEEMMTPGTPYPSEQLEKEAETREISLKVLKRAKQALGVIARQVGSRWYCTLPPLSLL